MIWVLTWSALLPRCQFNFRAITLLWTRHTSRFPDFARYSGMMSYGLINRCPGFTVWSNLRKGLDWLCFIHSTLCELHTVVFHSYPCSRYIPSIFSIHIIVSIYPINVVFLVYFIHILAWSRLVNSSDSTKIVMIQSLKLLTGETNCDIRTTIVIDFYCAPVHPYELCIFMPMAQTTLYHMYIQIFKCFDETKILGGGGSGGEWEHKIRHHIAFMASHNI